MYEQVISSLRTAYNQSAAERDQREKATWKLAARQGFLELLQQEHKTTLLEIGAGTGQDSKFFQDRGLTVTCTDLTPEMVRRCQEKGLNASTMDFLHLDFPTGSFDAIYAVSCLLHVPNATLPDVLQALQRLLKPGGLFYIAVYGGNKFEGTFPDDKHEPKRFFSYRTDEEMQRFVSAYFKILSFKTIEIDGESGPEQFHVQSIVLQRV